MTKKRSAYEETHPKRAKYRIKSFLFEGNELNVDIFNIPKRLFSSYKLKWDETVKSHPCSLSFIRLTTYLK